jgi:hypothetical protein
VGGRTRFHVGRAAAALLAFTAALLVAPRARAALEEYDLYVIWLQGEGEGDRANLDQFIGCLLHRTSYEQYWNGSVTIVEAGSYVVPRPSGALGDAANIGPFIQGLITSKAIPSPTGTGVPVYAVMVDPNQTSCSLGGGTGGRNAVGSINGKKVGLIIGTTNPAAFWPARTPLACETTLTEHEVAEVIDGLRGGDQCCGDCCCEGWCNSAPSCANFSGLQCPGAPASTFTGASACGSVKGFLVQTLSHQGAHTCNCPTTCDTKLSFACNGDKDVLHAPCKQDGDCCTGLSCQEWSYSGKAPYASSCCKAVGSKCADGTECCGGLSCTGGVCACVAAGAWCLNDGDCCGGLVCDAQANKCVTAPPPDAGLAADGGGPSHDAGGGSAPDAGTEPLDDDAGNGATSGSGGGGGCSCNLAATQDSAAGGLTLLAIAAAAAMGVRRRKS